MRNRDYVFGAFSAMAIAACSPSAPDANGENGVEAMPEMTTEAPSTDAKADPITGVAVVTAVDREAGTIGLQHEPIPALNWSSMTMTFAVESEILGDVAVGDSVSFTIKSPAESQVLTHIQKE